MEAGAFSRSKCSTRRCPRTQISKHSSSSQTVVPQMWPPKNSNLEMAQLEQERQTSSWLWPSNFSRGPQTLYSAKKKSSISSSCFSSNSCWKVVTGKQRMDFWCWMGRHTWPMAVVIKRLWVITTEAICHYRCLCKTRTTVIRWQLWCKVRRRGRMSKSIWIIWPI